MMWSLKDSKPADPRTAAFPTVLPKPRLKAVIVSTAQLKTLRAWDRKARKP